MTLKISLIVLTLFYRRILVITLVNGLFISLIPLAGITPAVEIPCPIKTSSAIPSDGRSKSSYSLLQFRENVSQLAVERGDRNPIGPIRRDRIESLKFCQNNIPEDCGGSSLSISSVVQPEQISTDSSHNEGYRNLWNMNPEELDQLSHDISEGMWYGLIVIFVMFIMYLCPAQRKAQPTA